MKSGFKDPWGHPTVVPIMNILNITLTHLPHSHRFQPLSRWWPQNMSSPNPSSPQCAWRSQLEWWRTRCSQPEWRGASRPRGCSSDWSGYVYSERRDTHENTNISRHFIFKEFDFFMFCLQFTLDNQFALSQDPVSQDQHAKVHAFGWTHFAS